MIEVLLHFNIHIDVHLFVGGFYSQSIPPKGCKLWSITAKKKHNKKQTISEKLQYKHPTLVAPCALSQNIESNVETFGHYHVALVRM